MLPSPALKAGFQQLVVLHHTARPSLGVFHDRIEALTRYDLLLDLFEDAHGDAEEDLAASRTTELTKTVGCHRPEFGRAAN